MEFIERGDSGQTKDGQTDGQTDGRHYQVHYLPAAALLSQVVNKDI